VALTVGTTEEENVIKSETIYQLIVKVLQLGAGKGRFPSPLCRKRQPQKNPPVRHSLETGSPD